MSISGYVEYQIHNQYHEIKQYVVQDCRYRNAGIIIFDRRATASVQYYIKNGIERECCAWFTFIGIVVESEPGVGVGCIVYPVWGTGLLLCFVAMLE